MKLVVLSGGIAAGKSTVARRLSELGAIHIDADQLARQAVEPGSRGLERVRQRFGDEMISSDGSLDRARLGKRVFSDKAALSDLNGIIHPEVHRIALERLDQIEAGDPDAVAIYDVPLLVETGLTMPWDLVVIVDAPAELRARRLVQVRGMSEQEAAKRIASQASDEDRRAAADVLIDASGTEAETIAQAEALWARLRS